MSYGSIPSSAAEAESHNAPRRPFFRKLAVGSLVAGLVLAATVIHQPWYRQRAEDRLLVGKPTPPESSLSSRGQGIKATRDDLAMFMKGAMDPYDPTDNPDGYLVMLIAENKLMWKELARKIEAVQAANPLPQWIFNYGLPGGQVDFVKAMANLFSKWIHAPVDPTRVRVFDGAGAVLAQLSYVLTDTNDGVLVTGPDYPAFAGDFGVYGGAQLYVASTQASNGFAPTTAELEEAYRTSQAAGHPPKILIICQPNNPTGVVYSADAMRLMIEWASEKDLHVVSDEIYALSVFPGVHTTSAADIMRELHSDTDDYLGDRVHVVAGLSKDWGMSGFRVGTLLSHNTKVLQALDMVGYYLIVSQYTQHALTKVFEDDEWVDWYIAENQRRLWDTYQALETALSLIDVPLSPAQGSLFAWADFSSFLKEGQTEEELWVELADDAKVIFTTGKSCKEDKPGRFRVVYPWPEGGPEAMKELGNRLVQWKAQRA